MLTLLIARKTRTAPKGSSARIGSRIAVLAIAVSTVVIILAEAVTAGFQTQVAEKVTSLAADCSLTAYDPDQSWNAVPVERDSLLEVDMEQIPGVAHCFPVADISAVMRDTATMTGVTLRGVDGRYPADELIGKYLTHGTIPDFADPANEDKIVIGSQTAAALNLKTGDPVELVIFAALPMRITMTVAGVFASGMQELDQNLALTALNNVTVIKNFDHHQIDAYQITFHPWADPELTAQAIDLAIADRPMMLHITRNDYPQIFDWLDMLDNNVTLLLIIMNIVAGITMISAVLIIVLENTRTIGTLKSLGMKNRSIRTIFLLAAARITGQGVLTGTLIALAFCGLQDGLKIIPLDSEAYMLSYVPIAVQPLNIIEALAYIVAAVTLCTIVSTAIITKISPAKSLKFT